MHYQKLENAKTTLPWQRKINRENIIIINGVAIALTIMVTSAISRHYQVPDT